MNKAMDIIKPKSAMARTTITVSQEEMAALTITAARTAKLEGLSKLSARDLVNKMHLHWLLHLSKIEKSL